MSDPQKSECPGGAGQVAKLSTNAQIVADDDAKRKTEASLVAQFAMHGHEVHRLSDGAFLVARWGLTRRCADLAELQAFAQRIGATE